MVERSGRMPVEPVEWRLEFTGELWHWRGPSPYFFVTVPDEQSQELRQVSRDVSYGWGMIPVLVRIGRTEWRTSLFPQQQRYVVPVKLAARRAERPEEGDLLEVRLALAAR